MRERFLEHWNALDLGQARIILGFSGGPDSTCLLHLLRGAGIDVVAAHLNHGMRPEAQEEAEQLASVCESLGVDFLLGHSSVPTLAAQRKISLEMAGREARYEFLRQAKHRIGYEWIATAHTQDDHLETVLLHLTRGTGLKGIGGIHVRRGDLLRPLLWATRIETQSYCREHSMPTLSDPANDDLANSRVRVRKMVVPELQKINPELGAAVTRLAQLAQSEDHFLDQLALSALESLEVIHDGPLHFLSKDSLVTLNKPQLLHHPVALQRRCMKVLLEALGGEPGLDETHALLKDLANPQGAQTHSGNVHITWDLHTVQFARPATDFQYNEPLERVVQAPLAGWEISAESLQPPYDFRQGGVSQMCQNVRLPLHICNVKPEERVTPLGLQGTKTLSNLLSSAGLSTVAKRRMPVVCDISGPIWVPGVAVMDRAKVTDPTKPAILLAIKEL